MAGESALEQLEGSGSLAAAAFSRPWQREAITVDHGWWLASVAASSSGSARRLLKAASAISATTASGCTRRMAGSLMPISSDEIRQGAEQVVGGRRKVAGHQLRGAEAA